MNGLTPQEIEEKSFTIIADELKEQGILLDPETAAVVMRCIHTTADFEYAKTLLFSAGAMEILQQLIREGADLVTDTNMAYTGINKRVLRQYGGEIHCFMADEDVADTARRNGVTRASVSMEKAMQSDHPTIFVIGNAPTALLTLWEHAQNKDYTPAFIIGVPVGFVNVVEAKERILQSRIPHIVNRGRKGGSNVAAAIVNAALYSMGER